MTEYPADVVEAPRQTLLRDSTLPLWRELGMWREWIDLRQSAIYRGVGVPRGHGQVVILVPGFLGSDGSLSEMRRWLVRIGYRVLPSGIDRNMDCPDVTLARLIEAAEAGAQLGGARVKLIGHSLGGTLSRAVAVRRPDLIGQVITLASPIHEIVAHPFVITIARFLESHLPSPDEHPRRHGNHFHDGSCSCDTLDALSRPFPKDVARTAIYTRSDGVIDWQSAREDDPEMNIEVQGSHLGLIVNREVYQAIGQLLPTGHDREIEREVAKKKLHRPAKHVTIPAGRGADVGKTRRQLRDRTI
ncbi:MAG: alpha/beta fold hydrolase [Acidobacteriota bacterium]